MTVRAFTAADACAWDELVGRSVNGTFLHTRRYLGYHGDRFVDRSMVVCDAEGAMLAVFPAAESPADPRAVSSHLGLSYGGLVWARGLEGEPVTEALRQVANAYRQHGFERLLVKRVPAVYAKPSADDDAHALLCLGAELVACELSAVILPGARQELDSIRKKNVARAANAGVVVREGSFSEFWPVLEHRLQERHGATPVHTLAEIELLGSLFPKNIRCQVAEVGGEVAAGAVLYDTGRVVRTQYLATTEIGRRASALDLLLEREIAEAGRRGQAFDLGGSTTEGGRMLNEGLYRYKLGFGAGGALCQTFQLTLNPAT